MASPWRVETSYWPNGPLLTLLGYDLDYTRNASLRAVRKSGPQRNSLRVNGPGKSPRHCARELFGPQRRSYTSLQRDVATFSLSRCGIAVQGRSSVLRLNYRSTAQIVRWAMSVMVAGSNDEFEDGNADRRGYRSVLRREAPVVSRFERSKDEIDGLISSVRALIGDGARPDEILVAARTNETVNRIQARLEDAGIASVVLGKSAAYNPDKVHVSTFHRLKGLEYKHVLLVDISKGTLPSPNAVTSVAIDPQRHKDDIASERSLLFVAATRARDSLHVSYAESPSEFLPVAAGLAV